MTAELATAYVRLRPKSDGFKTEADAQLKRSTPGDVQVQVSADTRPADERIALLKDRLDTLRLRTTEARVRLAGDDKALGKLAALDAAMIRLDRARANPKIDLEGVAKAEAQIATLNAQLDRLGGRRAGGSAGGGGFFSRLAGAGGSGGFFSHPLIAGAVPLAGPLVGAAAGGAASFLTPSVAGTIGLGAFGFGAKASITQVDTEADQLAKIRAKLAITPATVTTTHAAASPAQIQAAQLRLNAAEIRAAQAKSPAAQASAQASVISAQASLASLQGRGGSTTKDNTAYTKLLKQEHDLLAKLDPAQRKAVVNVQNLDKAWTGYQKHLQPQSFAVLADGAKIAEKGLGLLLPVAQGVGNELDHLEKRADAALSQPFWHDFFTKFLATEAPHAIDTLGVSLGHLFDGFAHLAERFAPLGHDLEGGMVRISGRFDRWTQGEGPGKFVTWVEANGPGVGKSLLAIVHGVEGIATGLAPIGKIELQALTPVLEFVGDLGKQHPEVITALGAAYLSVALGLKGIAAVRGLGGVLGVVKGIAGGKVGGGGALGDLGVQKVFVVNMPPGGIGGGPGGPVSTVEKDAKKYSPATLPFLSKAAKFLRIPPEVGVGGALALTGATVTDQYHGNPLSGFYPQQFARGINSLPASKRLAAAQDYLQTTGLSKPLGSLDALKKFQSNPAEMAAVDGWLKKWGLDFNGVAVAAKHSANDIDNEKTSLAELRIEIGRHASAVTGAIAGIKKIPGAYAQLVAQAKAEGVSIGAALDAGITIGISTNGDKVNLVSKQLVGGVLHTMHNTAQLGSPSKITTQYGAWTAQGLAVGFAQQMPQVIATFQKNTAAGLAAIGGMVGAAQAQLSADMASRGSAASGIASGLSGAYGLGNAFGPYGNVLNLSSFLGGGRSTLRKVDIDLRSLDRKHLSPGLLAQIALLPPQQALALATNILSGKSGSIPTLNRLQSDIDRYAGFAGSIGANAQSQATILADQRSLKLLEQIYAVLKSNPKDYAAAFDAALRGAQVHHR